MIFDVCNLKIGLFISFKRINQSISANTEKYPICCFAENIKHRLSEVAVQVTNLKSEILLSELQLQAAL